MGSLNADGSDKTVTVLITGFAVSCPYAQQPRI
jgi:hypothetical protein